MRRRTALVAALLACLGLAACSEGDPDSGSTTDDYIQVRADVDGDTTFVQLPGGRVKLVVTAPRDAVESGDAADAARHTAADGDALVGVSWQYVPGEGVPTWLRTHVTNPEERIRLSMVSGGETYPLGDATRASSTPGDVRSSGNFYVPVSGSGKHVLIEVGYDGVTQSVDPRTGERETGRAAPLYDKSPDRPTPQDCSPGRWTTRGQADVECGWHTAQVPYLADLGWADQAWTLVQVDTTVTGYALGDSSYQLGELTDSTTLDGEAPATTIEVAGAPGQLADILVFDKPTGALEVARSAEGALLSGTGPETVRIELSRSLVVG